MVFKQLQPVPRGLPTELSQPGLPSGRDLPSTEFDPGRVAVLLNRNARRVNDGLARAVERVVGRENLFYSRSLEEAEAFSREIVQRGYGTVVCGGGDGTLIRTFNLVQRYVEESNAWRLERFRRYGELQSRLITPRFAFLTLGTGNGLRHVVGAKNPLSDLRTIVEDVPRATRTVSIIGNHAAGSSHADRFCFGGAGYDSMLLNDYNWLRNQVHGRLARPIIQTVAGYFAAMVSRTLPRVLAQRSALRARVTTVENAYFVDPRRGDTTQFIEAGSLLYEGPVSMLGMGTTPFFGYGFRIFPFAGMMPGMMHLRVASMGPIQTLSHLPSIWRGTYRNHRKIFDFLGSHVRVEFDRPFPFQHSGDDQGLVSELDLKIAHEPLKLVDLYKQNLPA